MEKSLREFRDNLRKKLLDIAWGQWSAMGVYSVVPPERRYLIDPEALMCVTMFLGRLEPRLFDECMDWLASNDRWVGMDRLKAIVEDYPEGCRQALGAALDYLNRSKTKHKYSSVIGRWQNHQGGEPEPLFRTAGSGSNLAKHKLDPVFKEWGLLRNPPVLRGMSSPPSPDNPANLVIKLRSMFGVSARAEVVAFLLLKGEGNSYQISRLAYLAQRNVYTILNDLAYSGLADKVEVGKESIFSLDQSKWYELLDLKDKVKYLPWAGLLKAPISLLEDMRLEEEAYQDLYLASSRFRDLLPETAKAFRATGLKARKPDPSRYHGETFSPIFIEYVMGALDEI
jgi:hypothetical protein